MWISRYIGRTTRKKDKYAIIILIFIIILKINAFNYINWNPTYGGWINNLLSLGLFFYWLFYIRSSSQMNFRKEVYLMMFLPFLSVFNSWSIYGQSPTSGIWILISHLTWIIYFILHKYKISESALLKVIFIVAIAILIIQIVQQITYPKAFFGIMKEDMIENGIGELAEMRNGLWRFRMHYNANFTAPILFASWIWLQKKFNMNLLLWIILLLISVYLTLTRQVMISCIITLVYSFFLLSKKGKSKVFILILIFIAFLYSFYDILFSSLAEQTSEESVDDNIRLLAASYFWEESLRTPFTFLFGIGKGVGNSALAQMQEIQNTVYSFFVNDVGFIGEIYERGLVYVLTSYYLMYRLFIHFKNVIPIYIRMFVLFTSLMSVMIFPFMLFYQVLVWTILLYISDLHINSNKFLNIYGK